MKDDCSPLTLQAVEASDGCSPGPATQQQPVPQPPAHVSAPRYDGGARHVPGDQEGECLRRKMFVELPSLPCSHCSPCLQYMVKTAGMMEIEVRATRQRCARSGWLTPGPPCASWPSPC